jgi:hypothetical protein
MLVCVWGLPGEEQTPGKASRASGKGSNLQPALEMGCRALPTPNHPSQVEEVLLCPYQHGDLSSNLGLLPLAVDENIYIYIKLHLRLRSKFISRSPQSNGEAPYFSLSSSLEFYSKGPKRLVNKPQASHIFPQ